MVTADEIQAVMDLRRRGMSAIDIAETLGLTEYKVRQAIALHNKIRGKDEAKAKQVSEQETLTPEQIHAIASANIRGVQDIIDSARSDNDLSLLGQQLRIQAALANIALKVAVKSRADEHNIILPKEELERARKTIFETLSRYIDAATKSDEP